MARESKYKMTTLEDRIGPGYIDEQYKLTNSLDDIKKDIEKLKEEVAGVKKRKNKYRRTSVKIRL